MPPENVGYIGLSVTGICRIRILTPMLCFRKHFIHDELNVSHIQVNNCPGSPECPLCAQGNRCFSKYAVYCLDRVDSQCKIFEFGQPLFGLFQERYFESIRQRMERGEETILLDDCIRENDWQIMQSGNGMDRTYTLIQPDISIPLITSQQAMIPHYQNTLNALYPPLNRQDVIDIMDGRTPRTRAVVFPKKQEEIVAHQKTRWQALEI